ncbi:hypothetical protein AB1Y20_003161 [Prymnesium parvum]|uniref:F-box domain-containing protein n=1 Tax=Prymnesium parvum TaxID=97485 RepID=A0AB34JB51_PRYPA
MLTLQEDLLSSLLAIGGAERAVTLLDIASDQDLLACLAEQSDAAIMGRLACCSKALRRYCMADALWKKFLPWRSAGRNQLRRLGLWAVRGDV